MYNRNNFPWWLDNDLVILILILLYYANNKDMFKPPKKNILIPIASNSPEHTSTDEDLNRRINESPESINPNINSLKDILSYLLTSNFPDNTKIQNDKNPFNHNSHKKSSSSINMNNDNSAHIESDNNENLEENTISCHKNNTPMSVINFISVLNINVSLLQKSNVLTPNKIIAHVPIIIAKSDIEIIKDSDIKIEENIKEILSIKSNIDITGMSLLYYEKKDMEVQNKLFIKGFIIKDITFTSLNDNSLSKKYIKVTIPFKHTSKISFTSEPLIYNKKESNVIKVYPNNKYKNTIKSSDNIHPIYYELNHFNCSDNYGE
ncbi:hypothetical protein [Oceanirhabdus seepicola]|uniref:DUF7852 domain-containing protein n=1 Tax=Oceanirhabdus seepicola TaxID=2828781 RepID=A0A9J6P7D0_9CLOT|nr:hypothetical protein [Oceanirhabdus seepicola]MCM1992164.1 hypothetical protein [Oceanirhabdus seepicola]